MRKTRNIFIAVTAIFVAALLGCGMTEDATVKSSDAPIARNIGVLQMRGRIDNFAEQGLQPQSAGTGNSNARTIMPNDVTNTTDYHYWLRGSALTGATLPWTEVTPDATGEFSTVVAPTAWEFTLLVTKEAGSATAPSDSKENYLKDDKALFIGFAYADIANSSEVVPFTVKPDGLTKATNVSFDINLMNEDGTTGAWLLADKNINKVYFAICTLVDGKPITTPTSVSVGTGGWDTSTYTYSKEAVPPGTYNFVVKFLKNASDTYDSKGDYWSDVLVVVPNRTDYDDVYIPDMLGSIPKDVDDLAAYYVIGSEDGTGREGFYKVNFQWHALRVSNEKYFVLQLAQMNSTGDTTGAAFINNNEWDTNTLTPLAEYTPESLSGKDELVEGSLGANNTSITLYLPLGKAYFARIRAYNDYGTSDKWTYLTIPSGEKAKAEAEAALTEYENELKEPANEITIAEKLRDYITALKKSQPLTGTELSCFATNDGATPTPTYTAASTINRYRIKYYVGGGIYKDPDAEAHGDKYTDRIVYYTKMKHDGSEKKALWAANADQLANGNLKFKAWCTEAVGTLTDETAIETRRVYKAVLATDTEPATTGILATIKDDDNYKYTGTTAIGTMIGVVSATGKISTDVEKEDDGGYVGDDNLELFADYTGETKGQITIEDFVTEYKLYANMVKWVSGATGASAKEVTTTDKVSSAKFSVSKEATKSGATGSEVCNITFSVTVPKTEYASQDGYSGVLADDGFVPDINNTYYILNTTSDATKDTSTLKTKAEWKALDDATKETYKPAYRKQYAATQYDSMQLIVRETNGKLIASKTIDSSAVALDSAATFGAVNVRNLENKIYIVEIRATKKTSGKTITRSVSLSMELED